MNKLFCCLAAVLLMVSCSKKPSEAVSPNPTPPVSNKTVQLPYTIVENFEFGSKTDYATANVTEKTGYWTFNDAILGSSAEDTKNATQSVRLRTGKLSMNFDVDSLQMIKFSHSQFSTDGASSFTIWYSTDAGRSYQQLGGTVNNNSTSFAVDSFKLKADYVRFEIRKSGSARMNIDDITFVGAGDPKIQFNSPSDSPATGTPPVGGGSGGGGSSNDVPPTTGDNSNLLLGNPSNATANMVMTDNYLIDQVYYVESYSSSRATPNWVSWHLEGNSIGNSGRQDNFRPFTGLPNGFYQVQADSYVGSGFDRGHNCPSGDRTSSITANSSTFFMTNMIPQAPTNNQQTWGNLENYLRGEMQKGYEVYIIMGSYGKGGIGSNGAAETINAGKVVVPSRVWKVAVILATGNGDLSRVNSTTRVLAVDTPNINAINTDWTQYITTVDAIEAATGYHLFSNLSTSLQVTLKAKKYVP